MHHGAAGIKRTKGGAEVRWRMPRTKVTIDDSVEKLGPNAVRAVQHAFATWLDSDQRLPDLTFDTSRGTRVALEPDGKSTILVAPITLRGHEHDLAITLTYSDENTGAIIEADIVINSKHAFRVLDGDEGRGDGDSHDDAPTRSCVTGASGAKHCRDGAYDLQNIVTHEVGHFFGLGEEMTDDGATMFFCTSRCETHKRELTRLDTESIAQLYQTAAEDVPGAGTEAGCGGARITPRGSLRDAALASSVALLLLMRRRRAR